MANSKVTLATIGYENADLADFVATLLDEGIQRLIDVRQIAVSRRKGFAKTALSTALAEQGISYVHLSGLGDPKDGRDAARAGDDRKFREIFATHMLTQRAQNDLLIAIDLVRGGGTCLMCYERDHHFCHRTIVASAISDRIQIVVNNLKPGSRVLMNSPKIGHKSFVEKRA